MTFFYFAILKIVVDNINVILLNIFRIKYVQQLLYKGICLTYKYPKILKRSIFNNFKSCIKQILRDDISLIDKHLKIGSESMVNTIKKRTYQILYDCIGLVDKNHKMYILETNAKIFKRRIQHFLCNNIGLINKPM